MKESKLTLEAKEAIRNYMVKIVAFPGVVLTILGFVTGFLVNDVAKKSAYTKAYREASQLILNLTKETSAASYISRKSEKEAEKILKEVEDIRAKLRTAEAFQKSEDLVKQVVKTLIERKDFKEVLSKPSSSIHFYTFEEYKILWTGARGGIFNTDVSGYVPEEAKGAILRVNVFTDDDGKKSTHESGSFVCADKNGNFSPNDSEFWHYQQNGFTNYSNYWVGGIVFCPLTDERKIKWKMMSNESKSKPTKKVMSYGTLIGWYK